jgi:uncharacterized protein (TIGR00156 family)
MKGVIVQIGDPKSIVLFNNGKIRAIPTPADCRVGMVVSVALNDRLKIIAVICAAILLVALGVFLGGIFINEGRSSPVRNGYNDRSRQMYITVEQAKLHRDDAKVVLMGNIVESLGDEEYLFRDSSGDITVEIEHKLLRNISVSANDLVEISGEVDAEGWQLSIEVENIQIVQ